MSEKLWYLNRCELFERLAPSELRSIGNHSKFQTFLRNSLIYLPADEASAAFLLASGRA